jgi:putative ABC transport system permease protein
MLDTVRRDLSFTARSLRRSPTFSVTVVLILGLAIGMSSAMFTVFRAVLLERLPIVQQNRVVELSGLGGGAASEIPITPAQLRRFADHSHTVQAAAGLAHWRVLLESLADRDRSLSLNEAVVTDDFFTVLGARPALGRLFKKGDAVPWGAGAPNADVPVVLSHAVWTRDFGGDPSILGHTLRLPKMSWGLMVIGIAPAGLDYPHGVQFWIASDYGSLDVVARLAPTATPETARQEFQSFLAHDPDEIAYNAATSLRGQVHTISDMVSGSARPALIALTAAVALLLLLACTNVGNLLLLRAAGRVREMAIRRAVGASAGDLVRQLLTESVLLALAGGIVGVLFARALLGTLVRLAPAGLPRTDLIVQAGTPVLTALVVTGVTVLLFGVLPSLTAVRFDLSSPLRADARSGTEGRRLRRVRQLLVASQVALAVVVLAGAGLLVRSLRQLVTLDTGYDIGHMTMLNFSLPWAQMVNDCKPPGVLAHADSVRWNDCYSGRNYTAHEHVMASVRAVPGVEAVSPEAVPPFLGSNVWMGRFAAQEQSDAASKLNPWFAFDAVGPEYFKAMGVPLLAGRTFTDVDREDAPRVAIITEGVARRLWPHESPIGKRLREGEEHAPDSLITVVGVVRDFNYRIYREPTPTVFRPYRQVLAQGYLIVRTRSPIAASTLRTAVETTGAGATFVRAQSMDAMIAPELATPRFDALLLSIFAFAALMLAAVGLYGIMASTVNQQQRELGIRMALGATQAGVRNMVLRQAFTVAAIGTLIGLVGAIAGSQLLTSMLFGVRPSDPLTLFGVAGVLLLVAAASAYVPARRATAIDPARALKAE